MTDPPEQPPARPVVPVGEFVGPARLQPVGPDERVVVIDILRGFALFGILVVNMAIFAAPWELFLLEQSWWTSTADRVAAWGIRFLAEGKFYCLFSLLFGLGVAIQSERAEARGVPFAGRYARRLLVLLLLGACHVLFLWSGDILIFYAVLGFLLLIFRRRKDRTLIVCASIIVAIPLVLVGAGTVLVELGRMVPQAAGPIDRAFAEEKATLEASARRALETYPNASFADITRQRLRDWATGSSYFLWCVPHIVAMFLLGLYAGRRRILQDSPAQRPFLGEVMRWGLVVGLVANLVRAISAEYFSRIVLSWTMAAGEVLYIIGAPALCLGYAAAIVLLVQREAWRNRLAPVAAVGRMALSNYLLQSLICTTIFYSYGLALFGKVGPAGGLVLTVGIYLVQMPLSVWWLRRFRFGPAEWLWRSLTYCRWQPMRLG